jgi:hypothetical protein
MDSPWTNTEGGASKNVVIFLSANDFALTRSTVIRNQRDNLNAISIKIKGKRKRWRSSIRRFSRNSRTNHFSRRTGKASSAPEICMSEKKRKTLVRGGVLAYILFFMVVSIILFNIGFAPNSGVARLVFFALPGPFSALWTHGSVLVMAILAIFFSRYGLHC